MRQIPIFLLVSFLVLTPVKSFSHHSITTFVKADMYEFKKIINLMKSNKTEKVKKIIDKGFDINSVGLHKETVLHWAAGMSKSDLVQFFLYRGADINRLDNDHKTPLFWASSSSDYKTIKLLLFNGADVDNKDRYDQTVLDYLETRGDESLIKMIKQYSEDGIIDF